MTTATAAVRRLAADRRALLGWGAALLIAGLAAGWEANQAGVQGVAAVPEVVRAALATVAVFGICGYALVRLLVPAELAPYRLLFTIPVGAIACGLALTLLGFADVPFHVSLAVVLAGAVLSALASHRRAKPPDAAAGAPTPWIQIGALAVLAGLIVAVTLLPSFRSGVATVTGYGSDAHLVAGSTTLLQHGYPSSTQVSQPIDEVQIPWRSKYPIFYGLAAVSSVAGLQPWQALMTVVAILLAASALGFFLLARSTFGAPAGVATVAMVAAVLDRMVFHLAQHPYYNQTWGLLTLPLSLVLAEVWVRTRDRRTLYLLLGLLAGGAFAYPLMLPFPIGVLALLYLADRRARKSRGEQVGSLDPRRLWRGPRSLLWIVPLGVLLLVPIRGVVEKIAEAVTLLGNPSNSLVGWRGDVTFYPNLEFFVGAGGVPGGGLLALAVIGLAGWGLWRAPRRIGIAYAVVLGAALLLAVYFHNITYGEYFYFKTLSFAGPLIVVAAVSACGFLLARRAPLPRVVGVVLLAAFCVTAAAAARDETATSFDQLTGELRQLHAWAGDIPPGASIRLDTVPETQLWQSFMLASHPLGSRNPEPTHPHVPFSLGAGYALDQTLRPPPSDAAREPGGRIEPPVFTNADYRLWKLRPGAHRDTTSRKQVPVSTGITLGDGS